MLNHTSGLHNALAELMRENPLLMTDWDECLNCMAMTAPETEPGSQQLYHYLSFGWLCGGIIEVFWQFDIIELQFGPKVWAMHQIDPKWFNKK